MSAENTTRKPSANKNIKKLRAISMVCSLTHSWQQWVSDNEEKQACEPSGWAPGCPEDPKDAIKEAAKNRLSQKSLLSQDPSKSKGEGETPGESLIRTAQVIKTVTRDVQERSAGIEFLTQRICKDPATDELDKMLSKKGSPTCRRKCSNMVSELMQGWKEIEKEKMQAEGNVDNEFAEERELRLGTSQENYQTNEHTESSSIRIKTSTVLGSKKDVEDANKINALSKKYSTVGNLKNRWQNWASEHSVNQKLNPFSEDFDYEYSMSTRLQKGEEGYGRPKEGSKTAERAKRAEAHIHREIDDMCFVIRTMADRNRDGRTRVTFGELFDRYVRISDKVVGILMRARKHGKLEFQGEMLWQGRDDNVIITLLV